MRSPGILPARLGGSEADMHKARAFFYVCAGLLCIALSYHLGARSAGAQLGGPVTVGDINRGVAGGVAAVVGRSIYRANVGPPFQVFGAAPPVPGTEPIVAVLGADLTAMLANGDVYTAPNDGLGDWTLRGNVLGSSSTPANAETWGAMKSRYRGERGASQPPTQDR